jgi:fatty-acid peroxygenase
MQRIPHDKGLDSSLALLSDGYTFIQKRCRRLNTDVFQTRLMLQRTICMRGQEAAKLFYDRDRFVRSGAAPKRLQNTLLGRGGVQGLDGEAHRRRKAMFMALMSSEEVGRLADLTAVQWRAYAEKWADMDKVVLFDEVMEILCRAVCAWAGVPLKESEVKRRTGEMAAMIDAPAAVGLRHLRGRQGRRRAEQWAGNLIERFRTGGLKAPEGSALSLIARYRDLDGGLLNKHDAAVELLNVLRPTVAVARYIAFAALALHEHPACREKLRSGKEGYLELFVHEVRRFYPFFPFAAARVRNTFTWRGYHFPKGTRVLLDLYGTDHDSRIWGDPEVFIPERFYQWDGDAYNFIPQGGGDHYAGHRCAGEWITISLMKVAVDFLTRSMTYAVPPQDLRIDLSRMPAIPKSRFVIRDVGLLS